MKKLNFIDLEESARSIGARVYLIENNVEVDNFTPLFSLIEKFAPATGDYFRSLVERLEETDRENKTCDFIAICWPADDEGSLQKALNWADKNNLKTVSLREVIIICKKYLYIYDNLSLDIIKLVSTSPLGERYFIAQIVAETNVMIYPEKEKNMKDGDFWFVFKEVY
ncbi:MAG: hypothetical protein WC290_04005 [archaeon]|jgi:hypothetical protein